MRTTVMVGYPGETVADLEKTVSFLKANKDHLDRIRLSPFKPIPGTRFHSEYERHPERFPGLEGLRWNYRYCHASYRYAPARLAGYRRAKVRLLRLVHAVNRKTLRPSARQFDGLM